jgi:hypothetical protein
MEFLDMAKVFPVEDAVLEHTRAFLRKRRDGKGGFELNPKALDSFGRAPQTGTAPVLPPADGADGGGHGQWRTATSRGR